MAVAQEADPVARADSIRAAMADDRPPGDQPTDWVDVVGFPLKLVLLPVDLLLVRLPALAVGQLTVPKPPGFLVRGLKVLQEAGVQPAIRSSIGPSSGPAGAIMIDRWAPLRWESALSIRGSQRHRAELTLEPGGSDVALGGGWQRYAQIRFHGVGSRTSEEEALYRREVIDLTATAAVAVSPLLTVDLEAGYEDDLVREPIGAADDERLSSRFDPDSLFGATGRQRYARLGAGGTLDFTRIVDFQRRGARLLAHGTLFRGVDGTRSDFHKLSFEAHGLVPLNRRQLLALRGVTELTRGGSGQVPFYHLSALGGERNAIGFPDTRFTDLDLVAASAEWRYEIWRDIHNSLRVESFLHFAEGAVARRVDAIGSEDWHASYGFGFRAAGPEGLLGLVYAGFSEESVRVGFGGTWRP
ncbi:MAG: BamA/TamA family outer membrane protein [Gemmatimonadota bacterium]